jgi:hypothetical protein
MDVGEVHVHSKLGMGGWGVGWFMVEHEKGKQPYKKHLLKMSNRVHYRIVINTVGPTVKKLIKDSLIHCTSLPCLGGRVSSPVEAGACGP